MKNGSMKARENHRPMLQVHVHTEKGSRSAPILNQVEKEIQKFDERFRVPIGLSDKVCEASIRALNKVLADIMMLRDLYKKSHWQVSGATFYQLHLLFDKHYNEQVELADTLAERIQSLGGISVAMPHDIAEMTSLARPPRGREEVAVQLSRLIDAHETILVESRKGAKEADDHGDDGTNDVLVSDVIRTHELQVWFLAEHLVHVK
jgi:starvation-inducible DNA-binding protein